MTIVYRSSSVQAPTAAPTISGAGSGFVFAHRRVNLNGGYSKISPVSTAYAFPVTLTPQSYADTSQLLRDEFLVSNDGGVTWRIIPRTGTQTGAQTVSAYNAAWSITSTGDSQSSIVSAIDLGIYDADGTDSYTFYAYNSGSNAASLTASVLDLNTGNTAIELSGLVQIALTGVFPETGTGTPNTSQNKTILWNIDGGIDNYFPVTLPSRSFARFTVQLINYPSQGGLASTINLGIELTPNQRLYTIPYSANWYNRTFLYNPDLGFNFPYIEAEGTTLTVTLKPLAFNYDGLAVVNASDTNFELDANGTYNVLVSKSGVFSIQISTDPIPTNFLALLQFSITGTTLNSVTVNHNINPKVYVSRPLGTVTTNNRFGVIDATGNLDYVALSGDTPEIVTISNASSAVYTSNSVCIVDSAATFVPGDKVYSDTSGKAITGTGSTPWRALSSASNGFPLLIDYVFVLPSSSGVTQEEVEDLIGTKILAGSNISVTYNDTTGETTIASSGLNQEQVEDTIGTKIIAGSNVTVSYNDTTGETTISSSGGGGGSSVTQLILRDTTPPVPTSAGNETLTFNWDTVVQNNGFTISTPTASIQVPTTGLYLVEFIATVLTTTTQSFFTGNNSFFGLWRTSGTPDWLDGTYPWFGSHTSAAAYTINARFYVSLVAGQTYEYRFFKTPASGAFSFTDGTTREATSPMLRLLKVD